MITFRTLWLNVISASILKKKFLGNLVKCQGNFNNKKRARGIEPLLLAWKAKVLPLNYVRNN
jgi:hypothetical protein